MWHALHWRLADGRTGIRKGRDGQSTLSGGEVEELVDESILPPHILTAHSADLTFSQDVDRFITLDGPPCCLELAESLLGVHSPLDGSVILLQDIVQVLHGPMPTSATECPFLLHLCNGGGFGCCQVVIEYAVCRIGRVLKCLRYHGCGRVCFPKMRPNDVHGFARE